ncbi:MAG TPA: AgmX/PglI C-terminal domain-containing protein, partial [Polyangiaceae bacterium]
MNAAAVSGYPNVEVRGNGTSLKLVLPHEAAASELGPTASQPAPISSQWLALRVRADRATLDWFKGDASQNKSAKQEILKSSLATLPANLSKTIAGPWNAAPCDDLAFEAPRELPMRDVLGALRAVQHARPCKQTPWVRLLIASEDSTDDDPLFGARIVSGRLPPELIQSIVRKSFGLFRQCYERGLAKNPNLAGRITTRFVIDRGGNVSDARLDSSTLPDPDVAQCIVSSFRTLKFYQPEGGVVTVVYPIELSPG